MKAHHTTPYPGQTATVAPTIVGALQTPAKAQAIGQPELRTSAPTITVGHLSTLTEWLYWQHGAYAAHLRWTFSAGGAIVTHRDDDEVAPMFEGGYVILVSASGEPLVKHEPMTPGSLGAGRRYAWREIHQDIADRQAETV